jgi:hypothetical protein
MNIQTKPVKGSVHVLNCVACDANFPVFGYEVESDADAFGLQSAGICNGDLVLLELSFEEWQATQSGQLREIPSRLSGDFTKQGYRFAHILRIETPPLPASGTSFADFRQAYSAPTVVYSCPCCEKGEAIAQFEVTSADYIKSGGKINVLPPLILVD